MDLLQLEFYRTETLQCRVSILKNCIHETRKVQDKEPTNVDCNICLEKCVRAYKSSCGHYYCAPCITKWLELQNEKGLRKTCPTCRQIIEKDIIIISFEITLVKQIPQTWRMLLDGVRLQVALRVLGHLMPLRNHMNRYCFIRMCCTKPSWMPESEWSRIGRFTREVVWKRYGI